MSASKSSASKSKHAKPTSVAVDIHLEPAPVTFAENVDGIRLTARYVKPLAITLDNHKPGDLSEAGRQQLRVVIAIADLVDDLLDEKQMPNVVRPWLDDFVGAWGGLRDALAAIGRLPTSVGDRGERATRLEARIFPDGAGFLRRDAFAAWAEADRTLKRVRELGLETEIAAVLGGDLFGAVSQATASLGEVMGLGRSRRPANGGASLQDSLGAFSREVARYARIIAAETDVTDARSVERYLDAVARPIDTFRSRRSAGGGEPDEPADPTDPTDPGIEPPIDPAAPTPVE